MKISKRNVDNLRSNGERYFVWDDDLSGFGVQVGINGSKTFICRYRNRGTRRQIKLGRYGALTPEEARLAAKKVLGSVALGTDPALDREADRRALRLCELVDVYLKLHGPKLKPRTFKDYRRSMDRHVLPRLGKLLAEDITTRDISKIHVGMAESPYQANRVLSCLSSLFNWGIINGYLSEGSNPARRVKRFREKGRQRYLSSEEITHLGQALIKAETTGIPWTISADSETAKHVPKSNQVFVYPKHVTNAIRLLLLTGCRLREILDLKWKEVDLERGLLFLSDSKTGQKTVILNRSAIAILDDMERAGTYVIPGNDPDHPRHDLKKPWDQIRAVARIEDVRLHDLRHTHASIGAAAGFGLPIVGRLLGHTSAATTQRYAHIADDPARRASDAIGSILQSALLAEEGPRSPKGFSKI